jgi:hypothetical protein
LIDTDATAMRVEFGHSEPGNLFHPWYEAPMTASKAYDPKRVTGYRLEQLAAAFDRVRHARDWKAPIRAVIPAAERPVVEEAVRWFTETVPVFEAAPGGADRLVVTSPGYRLGPSGNPFHHMGARVNK